METGVDYICDTWQLRDVNMPLSHHADTFLALRCDPLSITTDRAKHTQALRNEQQTSHWCQQEPDVYAKQTSREGRHVCEKTSSKTSSTQHGKTRQRRDKPNNSSP